MIIVLLTLLAALASVVQLGQWHGEFFMRHFMGFFLVIFAMFKLFDLSGFAEGFAMYDLIAKRWRSYALAYPFIELAVGLAYLADFLPLAASVVLLGVMLISVIGVLWALHKGLDVTCACLGTVLKVPLSTVAVVEDLGMVAMASVMLLTRK
jgi:hypothetical protein